MIKDGIYFNSESKRELIEAQKKEGHVLRLIFISDCKRAFSRFILCKNIYKGTLRGRLQ